MYPMIDKEKTGKRLEYLMRTHGMTPGDISRHLSLSCVQTVYHWLEGKNLPSIDNLYALSRLFHVRIDEMIEGNGEFVRYDLVDPAIQRMLFYRRILQA